MNLNNKFNIGEEVYIIIRKPISYNCPICEGTGKFEHNNYMVRCPHCQGVGKLTDKKTLWKAIEKPVKIRTIKASINSELSQSIKYKIDSLHSGEYVDSRPESQLFNTVEEARHIAYEYNHPIKEDVTQ